MNGEGANLSGASKSVLLAHPRRLIREGIASLLREGGFQIVGGAGDEAALLRLAARHKPDIILVHQDFSDDHASIIRELTSRLPSTAVIILFRPDEAKSLVDTIIAGAKGYLSVELAPQEFVESLQLLTKGDLIISCDIAKAMREELTTRPASKDILTDREVEILRFVAQGASNREISQQLFVSEHTVKMHLRTILNKLNLRNRQQAAAYAAREGLVTEIVPEDQP